MADAPLDGDEYARWQAAARRALAASRAQASAGYFEWACFLAEQAAQLGLKGLLHGIGAPAWGPDLGALCARVADAIGQQWPVDAARWAERLSRFYIPTRYPDAIPGGVPGDRYTAEDANAAHADIEALLDALDRSWTLLNERLLMSHPVIERRREERDALIERVRSWADELRPRFEASRAVVVHGSVARGDFNKWSDVDVLVLADDPLPDRHIERMELLSPVPPGFQPIMWTREELARARGRRDPIALEAENVGIWVLGSLGAVV